MVKLSSHDLNQVSPSAVLLCFGARKVHVVGTDACSSLNIVVKLAKHSRLYLKKLSISAQRKNTVVSIPVKIIFMLATETAALKLLYASEI